jgi:hypothetical protein
MTLFKKLYFINKNILNLFHPQRVSLSNLSGASKYLGTALMVWYNHLTSKPLFWDHFCENDRSLMVLLNITHFVNACEQLMTH